MSPMLAIGILVVGGFALLWGVQSLLLLAHGEKLARPLRYESDQASIVIPMKVMVQLGWLLIIVGYPLLIDSNPLDFYRDAFRTPVPVKAMAVMAVAVIFGFAMINLIHLRLGAIEFGMLFSRPRTTRRVIGCFVTPIPLAILEEAVFRGVLLHALLAWLEGPAGTVVAILIASAVFSSVHFVRRHDSKRKPPLQPAVGLFFVGLVVGTGYVAGGQTLWLAITAHAAGILAVELPRSFVTYKAKPLWIGYRSFPHSGPLGILHMLAMTALVWGLAHS